MKKLFSILQKMGKSLMLPVAVLPAAGILLRLGQPDLLNIPYMATAGDAIFSNLPMILAVSVAIGFSGSEGVAALAAVVGEFILEGIIKAASTANAAASAATAAAAKGMALGAFMKTTDYQTILSSTKINMGVFGGIIMGLLASALYNKCHNIKLPQVLGFFGGKRFVPIITSVAALVFGIIGVSVWGPVQHGIDVFAQWASNSPLGHAFYAAGKPIMVWPVGIAFFLLCFAWFYFSIKKFNIKTPGREDESAVPSINVTGSEKAAKVLEAIGGKDNIQVLDACITRLRLTLKNTTKVDKASLKSLGAAGILEAGDSVQIIFGTEAEIIKDDIKAIISNGGYSLNRVSNTNNASVQNEAVNISAKNTQPVEIAAPADGEVVSLGEVSDDVFAGRMLGDGFAVKPVSSKVYAPVSGEVAVLFPTKHAVIIKTEAGLEILVHIGIDTVKLNGEGFTAHISQGDIVNKGDLLVTFDKVIIERKAKSTIIPVIVTNIELLKDINVITGSKKHGEKAAFIDMK